MIRSCLLAFFATLLVAACAKSPDQIGVDNPQKPVESLPSPNLHKIFIMTTREKAAETPVFYNARRSSEIGMAAVTVSIPPTHRSGELEAPTSLPPNPQTDFTVIDPRIYAKEQAFVRELNEQLAMRAPKDRNILFFVHGFNNRTTDAVLRFAQFVEDTDFQGVPVLFTWASAGEVLKYVYDLNSALVARSSLPDVFATLGKTNANSFDIFAHSMGSLLTMEAVLQADLTGRLKEARRLDSIVLASPDIDVDLFRSQLRQLNSGFDRFYILVSEDDAALRASRIISGGVDRVGAADVAELNELGLTVIDLSQISDSASGSHSKFAGSPEVVQLLGQGMRDNLLKTDRRETLTELTLGLPIKIIYD